MHPLPEHLLAHSLADVVMPDDARAPLRAVIASLALGGAERIVLEWAADALRRGRDIEIAVLNRAAIEWQMPAGLRVLRRDGEDVAPFVAMLAQRWGRDAVVAAHLLRDSVLEELLAQGLRPLPVLHNARDGWMNDPAAWRTPGIPAAMACAAAVAEQARSAGCTVPLSVIRHRPLLDEAAFSQGARREIRGRLGVDDATLLIGMVGAMKAQKNYPRALRVLEILRRRRPAALAIVGGVLGEAGLDVLDEVAQLAAERGLAHHVKLPGFVNPVAPWFAAFDVLLNTSDYEGYSIATQEALAAGLPVVGTAVSGQVEDPRPGLRLLPARAGDAVFARALARLPVREAFPVGTQRLRAPALWSLPLAACAAPAAPVVRTLFVTANLNAGGAQRSLVNLVTQIHGRHDLAIAVCGETTHDYFPARLGAAGVRHFRLTASSDAFDAAESLLAWIARHGVRQVCFWNADPKLKLLTAKFASPDLRLIDISPGDYAFEEMAATVEFQSAIAYGEADFRARLDQLVFKYGKPRKGYARACAVIPNGVVLDAMVDDAPAAPRFLVSGRIAPSKHLEKILAAFARVRERHPAATLHVAGQAESRHAAYLAQLLESAGAGVHFRGALPDLAHLRETWSAQIVLGTHQGSPNAVLEAMAAGVPVIANDSGGTRELVYRRTGWLLPEAAGEAHLVRTMRTVIEAPHRARRRAVRAREVVATRSLEAMAAAYLAILERGATIHS
ncbi:MAG TPA: glycosyltransferase [Burkholderiales bacterium]|jgi:glycosyltransferase involved in cell wall biosynthesis